MSEEPKLEPGSSDDETLAVLIPFLNVLRSASPFTLDPKTLYGAITHFLSTLPPPHLITFTAVLVASPSLWDPESNRQVHVRDAVRLAVPARVGVIDKELEDAYFSSIRRRRLARRWLNEVSQTVISSETSHGRNEVTVGLLEGLDDVQGLDWGSARVQIEEELVMTLASILEKDSGSSKEILRLLCAAMSHIAEERLHILDLQTLSPLIQDSLLNSLSPISDSSASQTSPGEEIPALSRALGRMITVLDHGGPSTRDYAWTAMRDFCSRMRSKSSEIRQAGADIAGDKGVSSGVKGFSRSDTNVLITGWDRQKTALFAFLHPASSILQVLLQDDHPQRYDSADMATEVLLTLSSFSDLTDSSNGGFEGYDKVFYGCLDVLAARGGTNGVKRLFDRLFDQGVMSDHKAGFILVVGEQVVHHLDGKSLGIVMGLCQRQVFRSNYRGSFEAAHECLLRLIETASKSLETASLQGAFLDELLSFYPSLLLKQARQGAVKTDQLRKAFPLVVQAASRRRPTSIQSCLRLLDNAQSTATDAGFIHVLQSIRVSITPYILNQDLPAYLADLAQTIVLTDANTSQRLELAALAFKTVVEDLPDEAKTLGIEWWLEWRDRFEGRTEAASALRSRL